MQPGVDPDLDFGGHLIHSIVFFIQEVSTQLFAIWNVLFGGKWLPVPTTGRPLHDMV